MARIVEISNPFEPFSDTKVSEHPGGITIREWLRFEYPGFVEFERPTICLLNGNPLMRMNWSTHRLQRTDIVNFVTIPNAPGLLYWIIMAVVVIASVVIALSVPKPKIPGELGGPDPVYDLKGQQNQMKLGAPIEDPYGRCRLWPSYAARPYGRYIGNEQYAYELFCLGQGEFDIEATQIEDTPISSFPEVTVEIYPPGTPVTLFSDNVVTSVEVANLELLGTNETGYGWLGGYIVNPAGTLTTLLEVDVTLPQGLYFIDGKNNMIQLSCNAVFQYRAVDDTGAPIGSWTELAFFDKTLATQTPQRFTLSITVPSGRYEVRAQRGDAKDLRSQAANVIRWEAARAFLPSTKNYGNVTIAAMKAKATNNLNSNSQTRFNVIATRKLPIYNGTTHTWSVPTATRNPVWADCNIFRAVYGGQLADQYLDLPTLTTLAAAYDAAHIYFDWVFDQLITLWDGATTALRVGRAIPMLDGSRITAIRTILKTVPTAVFNQENMVDGSFKYQIKTAAVGDNDGVEITYIDSVTFAQETVLCVLDGEAGDNPEKITLAGCTDRTRAWREGMYIRACRRKLRENIIFSTGLEGHIPTYDDLIAVSHDLPRWGQGGLLLGIDGYTLALSEPVTFTPGVTNVIAFRKKDGSVLGPYTVVAGDDATHVVAGTLIDAGNFHFDHVNELPLFLFGQAAAWGKLCRVQGLAPAGDDSVEVTCVGDNPAVFDKDAATPPEVVDNGGTPDPPPSVPLLDCSSVQIQRDPINAAKWNVSWRPTLGATSYILYVSYDAGDSWSLLASNVQAPYYQLTAASTPFRVRVAAVGAALGPACDKDSGDVLPGPVPPLPPGEPLTYGDIMPGWLPGGALSVECKTRGGGYGIVGFDPYISSIPVRKFLRWRVSAGNVYGIHHGEEPGGKGFTCYITEMSERTVDPITGWTTPQPLISTQNFNGAVNPPCTGGGTGGTGYHSERLDMQAQPNMSGVSVTKTATVWSFTSEAGVAALFGGACPIATVYLPSPPDPGSITYTLDNEDTDEAAKARLDATLAAWDDIVYGTCVAQTAIWTQRTTGLYAFYRDLKWHVFGTSFLPFWDYELSVVFSRRPVDESGIATGAWAEYLTDTYSLAPGLDGGVDLVVDVPNERGWETRVERTEWV